MFALYIQNVHFHCLLLVPLPEIQTPSLLQSNSICICELLHCPGERTPENKPAPCSGSFLLREDVVWSLKLLWGVLCLGVCFPMLLDVNASGVRSSDLVLLMRAFLRGCCVEEGVLCEGLVYFDGDNSWT